MDVDRLTAKLRRAHEKERSAMTRLRRAQTLYEKAYNTRVRLMDQMFAGHDEVTRIADRLTSDQKRKRR